MSYTLVIHYLSDEHVSIRAVDGVGGYYFADSVSDFLKYLQNDMGAMMDCTPAELAEIQASDLITACTFQIEMMTNDFSPRAKVGETVVFQIGAIAEEGDLVVCDDNGVDVIKRWSVGVEYRAAQIATILKRQ